jgi:hypothetical protein
MSLFDQPKPYLNPAIWAPDKTMRPEVKEYLIALLEKVFPMSKVFCLVMLGSSVSYQYGETSDVDLNMMARPGEEFDYWHTKFKLFNNTPNLLPGTKHPINYFFQEFSPELDWSNSLGAYDLLQDKWVKQPIPFSELGIPEKKYEREIAYGKILLTMIESQVDRAKEAKMRGDMDTARRIYTELAILFKGIEDDRKTAYRYGTGTPALQERNILYKLIESSEHHELFSKLVEFYNSDINPIEAKDAYGNTSSD